MSMHNENSPNSTYVVVGENFLANIFDIEGEQFLEGGFNIQSVPFLTKFRNWIGCFLSSPSEVDLNCVDALGNLPVIANLKGGSTPQVRNLISLGDIQGLRAAPLFNPRYEPYVIYKTFTKGELSLYVIAGDEKDAEMLARAAGNDEELREVSAEHGTVAILVWKPANKTKPYIRSLLSGTCSFDRIQKALEKASKSLPFLNGPCVRVGDELLISPTSSMPTRTFAKPNESIQVRSRQFANPTMATIARSAHLQKSKAARPLPHPTTRPTKSATHIQSTRTISGTRPEKFRSTTANFEQRNIGYTSTGSSRQDQKTMKSLRNPITSNDSTSDPAKSSKSIAVAEKKQEDDSIIFLCVINKNENEIAEKDSQNPDEEIPQIENVSTSDSEVKNQSSSESENSNCEASIEVKSINFSKGQDELEVAFLYSENATSVGLSETKNEGGDSSEKDGFTIDFGKFLTTKSSLGPIVSPFQNEKEIGRREEISIIEQEPLRMVREKGVVYNGPKFSRPYYFDSVTFPRNCDLETTLGNLEMREFVKNIRSRHFILASRSIKSDVLESIMFGYKLWENPNLKCSIHPTHQNLAINGFMEKYGSQEHPNFEICSPIQSISGDECEVDRIYISGKFD
ncbi:unnamed protein product [Caenorhabditis angaria]|uniref:Uncharacterized protein n=1 Tax=Caenorhabditis angaria TaxID=860376 RepID=A0A9P1IP94_9PELO|nr:unnamed protein product [Caenorhabditis angaria]